MNDFEANPARRRQWYRVLAGFAAITLLAACGQPPDGATAPDGESREAVETTASVDAPAETTLPELPNSSLGGSTPDTSTTTPTPLDSQLPSSSLNPEAEHPERMSPEHPIGVLGVEVSAADVEQLTSLAQITDIEPSNYWISPDEPNRIGRSFDDPTFGTFAVEDTFDVSIVDDPAPPVPGDDPSEGREVLTNASGHLVVLYSNENLTDVVWAVDGHATRILGRADQFTRDQAHQVIAQFRDV